MKRPVLVALVLTAGLSFAAGYLTGGAPRIQPARATQAVSREKEGIFVTYPAGEKRVVQSLVVDPTADPQTCWFVEVNGTVYLCVPR
jgi:hypothetical protein